MLIIPPPKPRRGKGKQPRKPKSSSAPSPPPPPPPPPAVTMSVSAGQGGEMIVTFSEQVLSYEGTGGDPFNHEWLRLQYPNEQNEWPYELQSSDEFTLTFLINPICEAGYYWFTAPALAPTITFANGGTLQLPVEGEVT